MAIEIISGFDQKQNELLDAVRGKVSNETARLAIKWPARGLLTFQIDTGETYQYLGNPPSNVVADWALFTAIGATGAPGVDGVDGADGDLYATISTTSIAVPTTHPTTVNMTLGLGLAYTVGQTILIASTPLIFFTAIVTTYDIGTGALVAESVANTGTGTIANWTINLEGAPGIAGDALIHVEADVNPFDEAKVISVEAGVWTTQKPWSASILNDTRSNLSIPINGSTTDHSISYDGTSWYDNGIWRGSTGVKGDTGNTGTTGSIGITGSQGIQGNQGATGPQGIAGISGISAAGVIAGNTLTLLTSDGATWTVANSSTGIYNIKRNGANIPSNAVVFLTLRVPAIDLVLYSWNSVNSQVSSFNYTTGVLENSSFNILIYI